MALITFRKGEVVVSGSAPDRFYNYFVFPCG